MAEWNPITTAYYKWNYSWDEIKTLCTAKNTEYADKRKVDFEFLISLAKAVTGSSSTSNEEVAKDTGDGLIERSDDQDAAMREMLGADYDRVVTD